MILDVCVLAADILRLPGELVRIFYSVVLPILLLAAIGFALQRKFGLDMSTLVRLNFYFVIPALIYVKLVTSPQAAGEALKVVGFCVAMIVCLSIVTYLAAVIRRVPPDQRRTMLMASIFYNSGNYGLPIQELAFRPAGLEGQATSLQIFVILTQNFTNFTLGILLAAGGRKDSGWKRKLLHIAKFPPIYALASALATIQIRRWIGGAAPAAAEALSPFWFVITKVEGAFYAIALVTLGAQLALLKRGHNRYPVGLSVVLRLLVGPAVGLALVYALDLRGVLAQVMLVSTAMPTAVNCMLLCMEFDNHPDYAARAVFYSTLLSPLTVTLTVFLAQSGLLPA